MTDRRARTSRRLAVAVALAVSAVVPAMAGSSPVEAVVSTAGQICFTVDGTPGDAAIVNLTPVQATDRGHGQLISSNIKTNPPLASNVNYAPGTIDPNVAIATIGTDNQICYQNSDRATHHLIADHLGNIDTTTYTPATPNGAPARVLDTREEPEEPRVVRPACDDPTTTRYSTVTAHTMFGLASRAYEVEPGVAVAGDLLDDIGSATVHFPDRMACWELVAALRGGHSSLGPVTDTEVIVARNVDTDDLAVSFRGTELDLWDILTDLNAFRAPWNVAGEGTVADAVHAGFGGAYTAVRSQLVTVLDRHQQAAGDGTRVFFTGHSLGGALATIASIDLVDELMAYGYSRNEVVTYTFGAPRSLSLQMSNLHARYVPVSFAVANPNDPVPHVPSTNIFNDNPYAHLREMAVLHANDGTRTVRRNFGDGRNYRSCGPLAPALFDVGDHGRGEYDRRVGATRYLGAPNVWVTRQDVLWPAIDNLVMHWTATLEGPCDQVALWNQSSRPTSLSGAIRDRWVILDTNDQHTTTVNVDDANWIGYVDMFGKVISSSSFDLEP